MVNALIKRGGALLLTLVFIFGLFSFGPAAPNHAFAATRKKVQPKAKVKAKKPVAAKKAKKVKKPKKAKKTRKAKKAKKTKKPAAAKKAVKSGKISQNYYLEEGIDETGAIKLVEDLKAMGVEDAIVNVENNTLRVKFSAQKLSSIDIIKKLKESGYTVGTIE